MYETPEGTFIIPRHKVRAHHTRAALIAMLLRVLYGPNQVKGPPIEYWTGKDLDAAGQRWVHAQPGRIMVTRRSRPQPEGEWTDMTSWGAEWFPVVRARVEVPFNPRW